MDLAKIYSKRPENVHKGNFGSVLVVAGSKLYTGSAALAGIAALRTGADLVTIASPQRSADVAAATMPDLITFPLKGDYLSTKHIETVMDLASIRKINAVVIGPGLGRHNSTLATVRKLISKLTVPMVLDADALMAISEDREIMAGKHFIMTPHLNELAILLKLDQIDENFDSRMQAAKEAARKYGGVVLLKGHVDVITDGTTSVSNNTGTPFMTKGGFGDVLAGICASLLARGVGVFEAAHAAAYINGKAGEEMEFIGESVVASDIFVYLHKVIGK